MIIFLLSISNSICTEVSLCELSNSTESLIKNAINGEEKSYKELEIDPEFGQTKEFCESECELFIYSLDIALETSNKKAFSTLYKIIKSKYDSAYIQPAKLTNYLLDCFHKNKNINFHDNKYIKKEWKESDLSYYKINRPFLRAILYDKDTIAYNSLSDTLKNNCGKDDAVTSRYNLAAYIILSIVIADKYNSANAYFNVYNSLQNFYLTRGLNMGDNVYDFSMFFLEKAAFLGDEKSLRLLKSME